MIVVRPVFFLLIPVSDKEEGQKILVVFVFNCFIRQVVAVNKEIVSYAVCDRLLIYYWKKIPLCTFLPRIALHFCAKA